MSSTDDSPPGTMSSTGSLPPAGSPSLVILPPSLRRRSPLDDLSLAEMVWICGRNEQYRRRGRRPRIAKIADEVGCDRRTVHRVLQNPDRVFGLHNCTLTRRHQQALHAAGDDAHGRRRRASANDLNDDDCELLAVVFQNPHLSPGALARRMGGKWTRQRVHHLVTRFIPYVRAVARPPLSLDAMVARLRWMQNVVPEHDVDNILWSDESYVRRVGNSFRWLTSSDQAYGAVRVAHAEQYMVWACFSFSCGLIDFRIFPMGYMMTSERYMADVLNACLLPYWQAHPAGRRREMTFMQDGARCHTSQSSMAWFRMHEIPLLAWPAHSPDLNPIELLWAVLKSFTNRCDTLVLDGASEREVIVAGLLVAFSRERMPQLKEAMMRNWDACIVSNGGNAHRTS